MGVISQREVASIWVWGLLAPAALRGSRPLAVFIGDSVCSLHSSASTNTMVSISQHSSVWDAVRPWQTSSLRLALHLIDCDVYQCFHQTPAVYKRLALCKRLPHWALECESFHICHCVIKSPLQKWFWNTFRWWSFLFEPFRRLVLTLFPCNYFLFICFEKKKNTHTPACLF